MLKTKLCLATVLALSASWAFAEEKNKMDNTKAIASVPTEKEISFSPQEQKNFLQAFGWIIGKQAGLESLGLSDEEMKEFQNGTLIACKGGNPPCDFYKESAKIFGFLQKKAAAYEPIMQQKREEEYNKNSELGKAFLGRLVKEDKDVKKTDSGLHYKIVETGNGLTPKVEDTVVIDYEGKLIDGKVFDSTKERGSAQPIPLGSLVPGFQEGMQLVKKGGKIKLYIPAEIAYEKHSLPGIPAGSLLIFDVTLVDIKEKKAEPLPAVPEKGEADNKEATK